MEITPLDLVTQRRLIEALCGAWADDPSLPSMFADIEQQRARAMPRDGDYDASS
jgi:uncharacterized phage-associated protein